MPKSPHVPPQLPFVGALDQREQIDPDTSLAARLGRGLSPFGEIGAADTFAIDPPLGLRVMLWNVQFLGGGIGRGRSRPQAAIDQIAAIIAETDADLVLVVEVMQGWRRPAPPKEPVRGAVTRRRTPEMVEEAFAEAMRRYEEAVANYRATYVQALADAPEAGLAPGLAELDRIVGALGGDWTRAEPETEKPKQEVFTHGETYGFLYRADRLRYVPHSFELLTSFGGEDIFWPVPGYRAPATAVFDVFPGTPWARQQRVIAMHAPSPAHGDNVALAARQFAHLRSMVDTDIIVGGDFNLDTMAGWHEAADEDDDAAEEALIEGFHADVEDLIDYRYPLAIRALVLDDDEQKRLVAYAGLFEGLFERQLGDVWFFQGSFTGYSAEHDGDEWGEPVERVGAALGQLMLAQGMVDLHVDPATGEVTREVAEGAIRQIWADDYAPPALQELGVPDAAVGADWSGAWPGATSLFRKAHRAGDALWESPTALHCSAYDKLFLWSPAVARVVPRRLYVYPLVERCLLPAQRGQFGATHLDPVPGAFGGYPARDQPGLAGVQAALDLAHELSDHVPLLLDVQYL